MSNHILILFALALSLSPFNVLAQGVAVGNGKIRLMDFGEIDADATVSYWAEVESKRIRAHFQCQITFVDDACQLSSAQAEKLTLLCDGIAMGRVRSGEDQVRRFLFKSGLVNGDASVRDPVDETNKLLIKGAGINQLKPSVAVFDTQFAHSLFDDSFWMKVLKSTLADAQLKKYERAIQVRRNGFLRTAVANAVARIDDLVFLSEQQQERLKIQAIDALQHDQKEATVDLEKATAFVSTYFADDGHLSPILNESQLILNEANDARNIRGVSWGKDHWDFHNQ